MKEKIIRSGWTDLDLRLASNCLLCSDNKHKLCQIEGRCACPRSNDTQLMTTKYHACRKIEVFAREVK